MTNTDYKFWYIRRSDDVHIDEVAVCFFEGEIRTENELNIEGNTIPVTRYRRDKRLQAKDLKHLKSKKIKKQINKNDAVIYTPEDFGVISTDDELRVFLNGELRKDTKRSPVKKQNTLNIRKVK